MSDPKRLEHYRLAVQAIGKVTDPEDLRALWRAMKAHDRHVRSVVAYEKVAEGIVRPGARVQFDARSRGIVVGTVTKINSKTASVKADSGVNWKVAISLLQEAS